MKKFTVRIESFDNNDEDVNSLRALMSEAGFSEIITSDQGEEFRMPMGEFVFSGDIEKKMLLEKLKMLVDRLDTDFSILITESKGRIWYNLKAS